MAIDTDDPLYRLRSTKYDRVFRDHLTPLGLALEGGNRTAIEFLESLGAER